MYEKYTPVLRAVLPGISLTDDVFREKCSCWGTCGVKPRLRVLTYLTYAAGLVFSFPDTPRNSYVFWGGNNRWGTCGVKLRAQILMYERYTPVLRAVLPVISLTGDVFCE